MASGYATVKEVPSGDTLVLMGTPQGGPPPEIRLTLSSLQAPRLGNFSRTGETKDEPFAFQSREFLRKACIGKQVYFKVEYTIPGLNKSFGAVFVGKENLCVTMARTGWARVKRDARENECSASLPEMIQLGDAAEKAGIGMFSRDTSKSIRDITFESTQPRVLLSTFKDQALPAIVEYVRDGASFRVLLTNNMTFINLNLSGVQAPRVADSPEPFSREAKYFTELRLLNRDVQVVIEGLDEKFSNFYGRIEHPAGNIGVELLKNGLAKTADWSMTFTSMDNASKLRIALNEAKERKLRLWKDFVAPKVSGQKQFDGTVIEVLSSDSVIVLVGPENEPWDCEERKVFFSSVRVPRRGGRDEAAEPYAEEGKELLRSRIVGKRVKVSVEYERSTTSGELRKYASVTINGRKKRTNAAALLVENGYATVMRHRPEEERSAYYDELLKLEGEAKSKNLAMHSSETPTASTHSVIDLTQSAAAAKTHLAHLQGSGSATRSAGTHRAIIEYLIHPGKFRVKIPDENCLVNFALAGVTCPQNARPAAKGKPAVPKEPFSTESLAYSRANVMQREVVITIESMDKGGTAIGQLRYKKGSGEGNLAVELVQLGLARVNDFSASFTPVGAELYAEQEIAQKNKLRIWASYVPQEAPEMEEEETPTRSASKERPLPVMKIRVADIVDGARFFFHDLSKTSQLSTIEEEMKQFGATHGNKPGAGIVEPKKNMNCLALFDDGTGLKWFRAKILRVESDKAIEVRYIDFGNTQIVDSSMLHAGGNFSTPPAAQEACLAFIKVPSLEEEHGHNAAVCLNGLVWGKDLEAKVHGKSSDGVHQVSLIVNDHPVQRTLMEEGLGFINSKPNLRYPEEARILAALQDAQNIAHRAHVNIWQYGDPRSEDN